LDAAARAGTIGSWQPLDPTVKFLPRPERVVPVPTIEPSTTGRNWLRRIEKESRHD
jgi:hypothetical protein